MSTVPEAGPLRAERPALRPCVAGDLDEFANSFSTAPQAMSLDVYWG
ncbi:hypothetical protein JOF29_005157 [Kribbella aluminosa]|uniref:GNAT family N-acetyltransferase n=1 Tax=Kribbella aluminosa TaxID=416017 RepID=A0ABS4UQY2_9ACTN|nr:hypothetical protein [Kribbella aluminosa]MBP2354047.1 hypothetical protein [Kribbella aluminosa]